VDCLLPVARAIRPTWSCGAHLADDEQLEVDQPRTCGSRTAKRRRPRTSTSPGSPSWVFSRQDRAGSRQSSLPDGSV
jgi:hypothetical protein